LIDDTATTKEVVITGFQLWQSLLFYRHNAYAREVLFLAGFRFPFSSDLLLHDSVRLRSAQVGFVRAKDQAEIIQYVSEDTARPCIEMVPYNVAQSLKLAGTT